MSADMTIGMNKRLRLLAICNYPTELRPAHQVFVRALLLQLVTLGVDLTVIAPESLWNLAKPRTGFRLSPALEERDGLRIHRPRYLTFSNIALPFGGTTLRWAVNAYVKAVLEEVQEMTGPFDLCLAHFLYPHGCAASQAAIDLGIPAAVSLGESSFDRYESTYDRHEIGLLLNQFSGVIANSVQIKEHCVQHYGLSGNNVQVYPNGVDERRFFPRTRQLARQFCRLPTDRPIVIFTGQFIERKGPLRVLEAIKSRPEIGAVFLGYGPQVPQGPQVLFQGEVPHEDVPMWLSAADVFVLPTLKEGCSNSVLEALFCGLPIVSSDLPFNHTILDDQVAILADPYDVRAITQAIVSLIDSPERRSAMSHAAIQRSKSFRLADRARNVLAFLQGLC
jgi:glycosyltransferase involved in cell wall biosynthesis